MLQAELENNLAKLIAQRIVYDREMVVDFLRSRTDYIVQDTASNGYLASVLSDMVFDEDGHEKLAKILAKEVDYVNAIDPVTLTLLVKIAKVVSASVAIGAGASAIYNNIEATKEKRESAISGLTLNQVEYDEEILANRQRMSQEFLENVLANEREIQAQKAKVVSQERQQKLIYLVLLMAVLTASFSLLLRIK